MRSHGEAFCTSFEAAFQIQDAPLARIINGTLLVTTRLARANKLNSFAVVRGRARASGAI